jgi:hypothetical protein
MAAKPHVLPINGRRFTEAIKEENKTTTKNGSSSLPPTTEGTPKRVKITADNLTGKE